MPLLFTTIELLSNT